MTKNELIELLRIEGVGLNEGESSAINIGKCPRIVFWEVEWQDRVSSSEFYDSIISYQVSFFSDVPRHDSLLELRDRLRVNGEYPRFLHEYIAEKNLFHTFFVIETIEDGNIL